MKSNGFNDEIMNRPSVKYITIHSPTKNDNQITPKTDLLCRLPLHSLNLKREVVLLGTVIVNVTRFGIAVWPEKNTVIAPTGTTAWRQYRVEMAGKRNIACSNPAATHGDVVIR